MYVSCLFHKAVNYLFHIYFNIKSPRWGRDYLFSLLEIKCIHVFLTFHSMRSNTTKLIGVAITTSIILAGCQSSQPIDTSNVQTTQVIPSTTQTVQSTPSSQQVSTATISFMVPKNEQ